MSRGPMRFSGLVFPHISAGSRWYTAQWKERSGEIAQGPARREWIDAFVDLVTRPPLLAGVPRGRD